MWILEYTKSALKDFKKLGKYEAPLIVKWLEKNINGCEDLRQKGKALSHELKHE